MKDPILYSLLFLVIIAIAVMAYFAGQKSADRSNEINRLEAEKQALIFLQRQARDSVKILGNQVESLIHHGAELEDRISSYEIQIHKMKAVKIEVRNYSAPEVQRKLIGRYVSENNN